MWRTPSPFATVDDDDDDNDVAQAGTPDPSSVQRRRTCSSLRHVSLSVSTVVLNFAADVSKLRRRSPASCSLLEHSGKSSHAALPRPPD